MESFPDSVFQVMEQIQRMTKNLVTLQCTYQNNKCMTKYQISPLSHLVIGLGAGLMNVVVSSFTAVL